MKTEIRRSETVLFGNQNSGHSYKVALMLVLCDIPYTYRHISLALSIDPSQRPQEFRNVSQFGQVPVLIHDGRTLWQSNAILSYLAEHSGQFPCRARVGPGIDRWQVQAWLFWEAVHIGFSLPKLRFLYLAGIDNPTLKNTLIEAVNHDLNQLEKGLGAKEFLLGDQPSIADISCCGYLYWADQAEVDIHEWPTVSAWLSRLSSLLNWQSPQTLMARND